jgi:hypothetical protein
MVYFAAPKRSIHPLERLVANSGGNQKKLIVRYKRKNRTVLEARRRPVGLSGYIAKASIATKDLDFASKRKLQCKLQNPRVQRRRDLAGRRCSEEVLRLIEIHIVKDIEELRPELKGC